MVIDSLIMVRYFIHTDIPHSTTHSDFGPEVVKHRKPAVYFMPSGQVVLRCSGVFKIAVGRASWASFFFLPNRGLFTW